MDHHHSAFAPVTAYASQDIPDLPQDLSDTCWTSYTHDYDYASTDLRSLPFTNLYPFASSPFPVPSVSAKAPQAQVHPQIEPSSQSAAHHPALLKMPCRPALASNPIHRRKERSVKSQPAHPSHSSSAKRQKSTSNAHQRCDSISQLSECCSSCPDTPPCDVSDCCDEPECGLQPQEVVTCYEKSCEMPVCSNPCLSTGIKVTTMPALPTQTRTSNWLESQWLPQPQLSNPASMQVNMNGGFDGCYTSTSASPAPTTPSMIHNTDTPYSPNTTLPTPQYGAFPAQMSYLSHINEDLSAATSYDQTNWSALAGGTNNQQLTSCLWSGCHEQHFANEQQWLSHLHNSHIDPQMSFGCPLQDASCPTSMDINPVDHLQADHGFNFEFDGSGFSCPAPDCGPNQTFFTPSMFHNHFDHVHGVPAQGSIQCEWASCNTSFVDPQDLILHMSQQHNLPVALLKPHAHSHDLPSPKANASALSSLPKAGLKRSASPSPATTTIKHDPAQEFSGKETIHLCKWKDGDAQCGEICASEEALQKHLKYAHLEPLDKSSGYKCLWDGCNRDSRRGEKAGFTQRGKLERHMATHTGFKCCQCDECGKTFSAEQSLRQHMLLHRGEKPWKCKHCGKGFPQQSACTIHERTHTKEKPLQCPTCGKCFSESSNLSKHRKIHGEKGLNTCDFPGCGKSFHRFDQLKRHRATHERQAAKRKEMEDSKTNGLDDVDEDDLTLGE